MVTPVTGFGGFTGGSLVQAVIKRVAAAMYKKYFFMIFNFLDVYDAKLQDKFILYQILNKKLLLTDITWVSLSN
jgi:hypothetical protein